MFPELSATDLLRYVVAYGAVVLFFFLNTISFSFPLTDEMRPFFVLLIIYFWSVYRPYFLNYMLVFGLGLFFDFILNFPIGLHSLLFLIVAWLVRRQRNFFLGQSYIVLWIGYLVTLSSVIFLEYIFFSALLKHFPDVYPIISNFLISAVLFPPVSYLMFLIHRFLPASSQKEVIKINE